MRTYIIALISIIVSTSVTAAEPFELKDGDRVVLIGNTLIEREQKYGYWEAALTSRWPDRNITFRNLGWSGDTVWGEARAGFGTPADGFKRLVQHTLALKPTVIIIGYGGNEAFDGPEGLPRFEKGLIALLDALAPAKARFALLTPPPFEDISRPLSKSEKLNDSLAEYVEVIKKVASVRGAQIVGLFGSITGLRLNRVLTESLTDDGMHLSEKAYQRSSGAICAMLAPDKKGTSPSIVFDDIPNKSPQVHAARVDVELVQPLRFQVTADRLLSPFLRVRGLTAGRYTLTINSKVIQTLDAKGWADGILVVNHPQAEQLRQTIIAKNEAYFHRWRPQNETYLFGFRKHEQGKNAAEIPLFDPIVEKLEKEIARLRKPVPHVYELKRESK